jgi:hypothetical protein
VHDVIAGVALAVSVKSAAVGDRLHPPVAQARCWEDTVMHVCRNALIALTFAPVFLSAPAHAQQPTGADLLATKCFQCHTQAMWQDQRQDTRAWEANLYRMVGRGALWTTEEIKLMAAYLGENFGPNK